MKILKRFLTITMLAVLFCTFCGCGVYDYFETRRIEKYFKELIGETLELDLTNSEMIEYWNNQGWMGDGNYLAVFALSENTLSQLYAQIEEQEPTYKPDKTDIWHALPFPSALYEEVYSGSDPFEDTREDAPSKNVLPYVENGYWRSGGYSAEFDGSYTMSDFEFSLFDADMGRLYYYEYHM